MRIVFWVTILYTYHVSDYKILCKLTFQAICLTLTNWNTYFETLDFVRPKWFLPQNYSNCRFLAAYFIFVFFLWVLYQVCFFSLSLSRPSPLFSSSYLFVFLYFVWPFICLSVHLITSSAVLWTACPFFCFLSSIASLQNTMFQIVLSACVAVAMGYPRPQAQGPIATSRDGGLQIPGAAG